MVRAEVRSLPETVRPGETYLLRFELLQSRWRPARTEADVRRAQREELRAGVAVASYPVRRNAHSRFKLLGLITC